MDFQSALVLDLISDMSPDDLIELAAEISRRAVACAKAPETPVKILKPCGNVVPFFPLVR